jgi:soluble lytic murein transglycosylase-like protein
MKKRWILIGLISLFGYNICDQLDKPKKYENITFERVVEVKKKVVVKDVDYWIKHYSEKHNVDWKLVKAIMIFESGLNPKAKNPNSSAFGLGQTIKATNKWIHEELGYKKFNHYKTPIPRQVEVTCKYLSILKKQYKGNTKKALMAYNGFELGDLYWKKVYKIKNSL